jgi:hypothetical protein
MPSAEFKPAISAIEQLRTYALDQTANGIGPQTMLLNIKCAFHSSLQLLHEIFRVLDTTSEQKSMWFFM